MADKVAEVVENTTPEVEKEEAPEVEKPEETKKSENGDSEKNGDADEKEEEVEETNGKEVTDGKVSSIKRKSAGGGGDAPEETPAEGATPEKKAKLDKAPAEAEANGEAKVEA